VYRCTRTHLPRPLSRHSCGSREAGPYVKVIADEVQASPSEIIPVMSIVKAAAAAGVPIAVASSGVRATVSQGRAWQILLARSPTRILNPRFLR